MRISRTSTLRRTVATLAAGALLAIGATAAAAPAAAINTCYLTTDPFRALGNMKLYVRMPGCGTMSQGADWEMERVNGFSLQSSAVWTLQHSLRYCYGFDVALDGLFGKGTRTALGQTQTRLGLNADGVFGPRTRDAMRWPMRDANNRYVGSCSQASNTRY